LDHSGKTTNLAFIHDKLRSDHRGQLQTFEYGKTSYQVMSIELGEIQGRVTRFHIYALPGGMEHEEARAELSQDALGMIFVVDAQTTKIGQNIMLYEEMVNLIQMSGLNAKKFPVVVQFNKLDLPNAAALDELNKKINTLGYPHFKALANQGTGVLPTLTTVSKEVIRYIRSGAPGLKTTASAPEELPEEVAFEEPKASVPPLPKISPAPHTASTNNNLMINHAGPTRLNADGSHQVALTLKDPQSGKMFSAKLRIRTELNSQGLTFKFLPQEK
jgi:hypothetical protein